MPGVFAHVEPEMIIWTLRAVRSEHKQARLVQDGFLNGNGGDGCIMEKNIEAVCREMRW